MINVLLVAPLSSDRFRGGIFRISDFLLEKKEAIQNDLGINFVPFDSSPTTRGNAGMGKLTLKNLKNSFIVLQNLLKASKKKSGIEIIHFNTSVKLALLKDAMVCYVVKLLRKRKIIIHIHAADFNEVFHPNTFLRKATLFFLKRGSHQIITLSTTLIDEMTATGFPKSKLTPIYNFSTIEEKISKKEQSDSRKREEIKLLFVGSIDPRKGFDNLITALRKMETVPFVLNVCGTFKEDDFEKRIMDQITGTHLEQKVNFNGYTTGDDLIEQYKNGDVIVLPSIYEGMPLIILEALNFHCSFVISAVGAIPEIINAPENGFLVQPNRIDDIVNSIETLHKDRNLLEQQKDTNLKKSEEFSYMSYLEQSKKVYLNKLNG
jgi:glycosyltransferase involved in cell wall biosynthesis